MTEVDLGKASLGEDADDIYEELLAVHAGLSDSESAALNARLILVLINQIGHPDTIRAALAAVRKK